MGDTYHSWGDENSIEPFTASGDIFFAGRDIIFIGSILGTNSVINNYLRTLYNAVDTFIGLVTFSTPYGDYSVYVKDIKPEHLNGGAKVTITFREPVVTLTGGSLPAVAYRDYTIDGIPLSSFGLYLSKAEALHDQPELKEQYFTMYGSESYQIVKRKNKVLEFNGFIAGSSLSDFQSKVKALYLVFKSSGTRNIKFNDDINVDCFATEGFRIENVYLYNKGVIANFKSSLMCYNVNYINYLLTEADDYLLTEASQYILI
jgi:hypothetical protein